jgi:3-isopropylmalate dehydratase small subunit
MGRFEKISEKIMPYKIKSIISNTFADIMIINCGKYFEVQRINYKHETIFKKEVKKEIVELVLLSTNYMVLAIYEDNKYEIINIDKSEIIYSSSFEKVNITKSQGNIFEFVSPYKSTSFIQDDDNNTIEYSIPSLNSLM